MQFSGQDREQDLVSEVDFLCDSSVTSYPLKDKVRRYNASVQEVVSDIINADGTFQWDDTNYTDKPIGTGLLVDGQASYSFAEEYLQVEFIEILNKDGTLYIRLKPIDKNELKGLSTDEYFGVDTSGNPTKGFPEWYDLHGDTVDLYPAPDPDSVTLVAGLRIHFKRAHREITMDTDTAVTSGEETREPPLPSTHHIMIAYMMAIPYCMSYKKDRVAWLEHKVGSNDTRDRNYGGLMKSLMKHYGFREKDKRKVMRMKRILYI